MKVFYRPEQVATSCQPSPSALKPRLAVADWLADPLIHAEICSFERTRTKTLCLAHDPAFVRSILSGRRENGFGNTDADVARSLPYTTGSMVAAAEYALRLRRAAGHVAATVFRECEMIQSKDKAPRLTPRQFRVCEALAQRRKLWREEVDSIAGASNGPEIMRQLRNKGLEWSCERVLKIDRDGKPCEPGLYSIDDAGRDTLTRWGY